MDILYGGLGIGKLQFLIQKKFNFFSAVIFFQFLVIKAQDPDWIPIRIGLQPQTLDPDPDQMNTDPKSCLQDYLIVLFIGSVHMHICWIQVLVQYVATRQIRIRTIHANPDPGFVFTLKVHLNHIYCLSIT
jgi:hypothetical protein